MLEWALGAVGATLALTRTYSWTIERIHDRNHYRDDHDVAIKAYDKELKRRSKTLFVSIHGSCSIPDQTPEIFTFIREHTDFDYWAPRLLFHGQSLRSIRAFNPDAMRRDFLARLRERVSDYDQVIMTGASFSGVLLTDMAIRKELPKNTALILVSPSFAVTRLDKPWKRVALDVIDVCMPYSELGPFRFPRTDMYEPEAKPIAYETSYFRSTPIKQLATLLRYCPTIKPQRIDYPVHILTARNDPYVDFAALQDMSNRLGAQSLRSLQRGRHMIFWGHQQQEALHLLGHIIQDIASASAKHQPSTRSASSERTMQPT